VPYAAFTLEATWQSRLRRGRIARPDSIPPYKDLSEVAQLAAQCFLLNNLRDFQFATRRRVAPSRKSRQESPHERSDRRAAFPIRSRASLNHTQPNHTAQTIFRRRVHQAAAI
jgi:hypothetical protein